ncbi:S9 family peptidase [Williamwhitmania taraxaci]|uniref:Dipeptidyl-peptidase 5 n=1 Tax=Williamwhitmania taraxaci TaxID=1640674 RepID=A0A1G6JSS5_9BACT|nr:S9 family peptidase [Williamwhitmania taraxaci]SDC21782.1 Dipeptidyl aminopeptidase/acylaminoacyl peptidase [Williamwhitmania taraxaci]
MRKSIIILATGLALFGCKPKEAEVSVIGKPDLKLTSTTLTPEVLWSFGRLGDTKVSPDGKQIAYTVTYYSISENKGNAEIYIMNADGSDKKQLTKTPKSEFGLEWKADGSSLYFMSAETGNPELFSIKPDGSDRTQLTHLDKPITNYLVSPAGGKILLTIDTKVDTSTADRYPDLDKSDGMVITDLMYRHWDSWEDGSYQHIYIADFDGSKIGEPQDIMPGEAWDSPLMPFGGIDEISWSPDGKSVAYTCKKQKGKDYAFSTNSDIYLYNLESKETKNLTEGMPGYDRVPVFTPQGDKMLWVSMARGGFEADRERLFCLDFKTGEKKELLPNFDHSPASLSFTADGKTLYFVTGIDATFQVYGLNMDNLELKPITKGWHDYHSVEVAGNTLVGTKVSIVKPAEIYTIDPTSGTETELSFINKELLDQLHMPKVTQRMIKTSDGMLMPTWVILPPDFDSTKKYPALLYCEGGPQSPVSQFWSYRWNFSIMASNGYVIVAPSRRGVLTLGQKWTDAISKDHGGQEMRDLLCAIDEVKQEPWVDADNLGATGASYGGYTVYWLAGNHHKRFKAFLSHCGVFNSEMEYMTTDEMFFDSWEMGGAPWETNNKVAMKSFSQSPHKFVKNWDTPILIIEGGNDFRIPYTQGMAAFNTAQELGVPSKFLFFPSESHWVLKPQNGILWQREYFAWFDKWLKVKK